MRTQGTRGSMLRVGLLTALVVVLAGCAPQNGAIADLELIEFPDPVAVEPGLTLGMGEAAWVEQASAGTTTLLGVAVLDIIEGEPWFWKNYNNGDQFLGYTPYFVIVQREWVDAEKKFDVTLYPVLEDGTPAGLLDSGAFDAYSPATCGSLEIPQPSDPRQRVDCIVTAAVVGERVAGVYYDGTFADEGETLEPTRYLDSPVFWMAE